MCEIKVYPEEKRPYVCPVCNGTRHVPEGFYRQNLQGEWSSPGTTDYEPCRTCKETGIVWN
jgi:hypothetical protein